MESGGEVYINDASLSIESVHPENNLSSVTVQVSDYQNSKYEAVFDALGTLDLSFRYGTDSWTKVFSGLISIVSPAVTLDGEVLQVGAWGLGNPLAHTYCNESYGVESINNNAVDTPKEILEDLIDEHVNKIFGAAVGGGADWTMGKQVDNAHAGLSVTHLQSHYDTNFTLVNKVCDLTTSYAANLGPPEVGTHWFVDANGDLYFKKIDANHTSGNWPRYWKTTQANSKITVKEDMVLYDFRKHTQEYANHVLISSKFRMPGEDYWTEDNGGQALWGDDGNGRTADSATHIVGSHSVIIDNTSAVAAGEVYYPAGQNASWDLEKCGSRNTIPTFGFYARKTAALGTATFWIHSAAGNHITPYNGLDTLISEVNQWFYISVPVGPYFDRSPMNEDCQMTETAGAIDWSDIDYIRFTLPAGVGYDLFVDDMHFSGVVVREAKDTAAIGANKTYMKIMRNDTAVCDTLQQGTPGTTDTGAIAQLAHAELLRRSCTPIVGMIQTPLIVDLLPGQTVYVEACQQASGAYRIDKDMRVVELRRSVRKNQFRTVLNLTDDVENSHAFGAPTMLGMLKAYAGALGSGEARDVKGGALDNQIPRLTETY